MAYLFLDRNGWNEHVEESVCLIVQPDGVPPAKFEMRAKGPQVPGALSQTDDRFQPAMRSTSEFQAQVPSLAPFLEPVSWDDIEPGVNPEGFDAPDQSWNKVGGTPVLLHGESEWEHTKRFLFEFGAEEAGYELADGAHCYGFIDPDTLEGHFSWDCH